MKVAEAKLAKQAAWAAEEATDAAMDGAIDRAIDRAIDGEEMEAAEEAAGEGEDFYDAIDTTVEEEILEEGVHVDERRQTDDSHRTDSTESPSAHSSAYSTAHSSAYSTAHSSAFSNAYDSARDAWYSTATRAVPTRHESRAYSTAATVLVPPRTAGPTSRSGGVRACSSHTPVRTPLTGQGGGGSRLPAAEELDYDAIAAAVSLSLRLSEPDPNHGADPDPIVNMARTLTPLSGP